MRTKCGEVKGVDTRRCQFKHAVGELIGCGRVETTALTSPRRERKAWVRKREARAATAAATRLPRFVSLASVSPAHTHRCRAALATSASTLILRHSACADCTTRLPSVAKMASSSDAQMRGMCVQSRVLRFLCGKH